MAQGKSHSITRRTLLTGAATTAATALAGSSALPASPPDVALGTLGREFATALVVFEAAHERYSRCEQRYFTLRRRARTKAARTRIRRESDVPAAEAATDAAVEKLYRLMRQMHAAAARSPAGLAVKARAVKVWGYPEWWDKNAEVPERLAAQVLDAVIEMAAAR